MDLVKGTERVVKDHFYGWYCSDNRGSRFHRVSSGR